jgi:hypothetical protein
MIQQLEVLANPVETTDTSINIYICVHIYLNYIKYMY